MADPEVEGPAHYDGDECMKLLEDADLGRGGCLFNIGKYLYRLGSKGRPVQDAEKARWYARRLAERHFYGSAPRPYEVHAIRLCLTNALEHLTPERYEPARATVGEVFDLLTGHSEPAPSHGDV